MLVPGEAGGPRTDEGKEIVRWNATRHGISFPAPVVPGLEKSEEWQEHSEGILDNLSLRQRFGVWNPCSGVYR